MKQRFSSREQLQDYDAAAAAAAAAARARGFSRLTKFMKVTNRGSTTTPSLQYHNSLLMSRSGRLPEQLSSSLSNLRRRTESSNQEELPQPNRMYTCKTCGRQFETFQALGGHRASHKMKLVGEDGSYQHFQYKAKLHRCSICNEGYQTGQALGGHMRKHRELLENKRLAAADQPISSNVAHHQNQNVINTAAAAANHQSNALRWAQMNAAAILQYSNSAPHPTAGAEEEILKEKIPTRKGLKFDLNLDVLENEELGLGTY